MMNTPTALVLLSFVITLVDCQPNAGTCTAQQVDQYALNTLGMDCRNNLGIFLYSPQLSPELDMALDAACTPACSGRLTSWLQTNCRANFNATSVYYLCLRTGNTGSIGRYCRYAIPPQFDIDAESAALLQACGGAGPANPCPSQCATELQNLANQLGCCYQSIYNNTAYVLDAAASGEINSTDVFELSMLGDPSLWSACRVTPPTACTDEAFDFPTPVPPPAGTCDVAAVNGYVVSKLGLACGANLATALYSNLPSPGADTALNAACTEDCAGDLANWIQRECGGTFNATSLYYLCLQTQGGVGRYCRYAVPPVYDADRKILAVFSACIYEFR